MPRKLDPVEEEYEQAMRYARSDEEAYELSIGLRQYHDMFQDRWWEWGWDVSS